MAVLQYQAERKRETAEDDTFGLVTSRAMGRYLVGSKRALVTTGAKSGPTPIEQLKPLNTGPVDHRLRYLVLVGEMCGPRKAIEEIAALKKKLAEHDIRLKPEQAATLDILNRLYHDYGKLMLDGPSVT